MTDKTTEIEVVAAPDGYEKTDYQFFKSDSGQVWKASVVIMPAHAPVIDGDVEAAPTQLAVKVVVSPVDESGKALREDEKPIIVDAHLHTFTQVEMAEPDFDPIERVMKIVVERVHVGEARLGAVKKINSIADDWNKKAKLKVGKYKYIETPTPEVGVAVVPATKTVIEQGETVSAGVAIAAPSEPA